MIKIRDKVWWMFIIDVNSDGVCDGRCIGRKTRTEDGVCRASRLMLRPVKYDVALVGTKVCKYEHVG